MPTRSESCASVIVTSKAALMAAFLASTVIPEVARVVPTDCSAEMSLLRCWGATPGSNTKASWTLLAALSLSTLVSMDDTYWTRLGDLMFWGLTSPTWSSEPRRVRSLGVRRAVRMNERPPTRMASSRTSQTTLCVSSSGRFLTALVSLKAKL